MAFPTIFNSLASGSQPLSLVDTMFSVLGSMAVVQCTASGTNTIALAPNTNMPTQAAYATGQLYGFAAANTTTGVSTINVSSIGAKNAYNADGSTQINVGDLISGAYYLFVYNSALNSAAGGFQIVSESPFSVVSSINGGQIAGFRNRTINGDMRIDQRNAGASQTITAAASAAFTIDRFYATCTGANVAGQRTAGTAPDQYVYQFTGAASVTAIAFGQRYESTNVYDLTSTTASFSVKMSNSLLTTVTWTAYYPTVTDNWAARTQIATGTFTVTSSLAKYSTTIALGANITAGLAIELTVGAQISGTWQITEWQLENGIIATPFERRPISIELGNCEPYYEKSFLLATAPAQNAGVATGEQYGIAGKAGALQQNIMIPFKRRKRTAPTMTYYNPSAANGQVRNVNNSSDCTGTTNQMTSEQGACVTATGSAGTAVGDQIAVHWTASAELT